VLALSGDSRSGTELELLIGRQIAGISALSIIERVAVRCERRVVIVVERRARLLVGR
jgi:hypothetical protein